MNITVQLISESSARNASTPWVIGLAVRISSEVLFIIANADLGAVQ